MNKNKRKQHLKNTMVKNKNDLCKWHSIKFQFIKGPYDVNQ